MAFERFRVLVLGSALLVAGCSYTSDALWPSLDETDPSGGGTQQVAEEQAVGAAVPSQTQPAMGTSDFQPAGVTPGAPTGTFVGQKVEQLRSELQRLQSNILAHNAELQEARGKAVEDSQRYHGTVAAINARLQVGTTPGNPILVQQFNSAQGDLERISADVGIMNNLANKVAEDSTMASYLQESTQAAFGLSGAVDEDHAQLAVLQDEVGKTVVLIERLLKEVSEDVRRQTTYVATERSNLNTVLAGVKTGEIYGQSLSTQNFVTNQASLSVRNQAVNTAGRRPLVVIRFDNPNVNYQQALYTAVNRVLERRPQATFDLVAVAPTAGGPAQIALNSGKARNSAETVLRALADMGLSTNRVTLSTKTSATARTNEVHLYLR